MVDPPVDGRISTLTVFTVELDWPKVKIPASGAEVTDAPVTSTVYPVGYSEPGTDTAVHAPDPNASPLGDWVSYFRVKM